MGKPVKSRQSGQVVVEYVLMLMVVVTAISLFVRGFKVTIGGTWRKWNNEISAPCPGCQGLPPD